MLCCVQICTDASHYFLIMLPVHLWPRRFPISFSHFERGEYNMIVAHTRGGADSGSVLRTQIAFPLENTPAVLKALEGRLCTCHQLQWKVMPGRRETRRGVYSPHSHLKSSHWPLMPQAHHAADVEYSSHHTCHVWFL